MSTVAFIEAMIADGWSVADAVRAAKTFERVTVQPRSRGAERQARYRERHQASQTVTGDASDASDVSPPPSPPPSPRPPTTPAPTPAKTTTRERAVRRCPADWLPTQADLAVAAGEGFSPGEIDRELSMIRDHQFATAHSDWSAVFRNWIRRAAKTKPKPRQANDQPSRIDERHARAFAASERAIAQRTLVGEGCG